MTISHAGLFLEEKIVPLVSPWLAGISEDDPFYRACLDRAIEAAARYRPVDLVDVAITRNEGLAP